MPGKATTSSLCFLLLTLAAAAAAELGGNANSVADDRTRMRATLRVSGDSHYTVHEMQLPSGTTVREYLSGAGTVFAVAWDGPELPDLQRLLGAYFERYTEAAQQRPGRGPLSIEQPDLVVQSAGHMRAFSGRAYIPDQIPGGVATSAIR